MTDRKVSPFHDRANRKWRAAGRCRSTHSRPILRISASEEDELLADLIRAATDIAERFIGQLLIERGVEEVMEPSSEWRALAIRPVTSIASVTGVPASGAEFALGVDAAMRSTSTEMATAGCGCAMQAERCVFMCAIARE